MRDSPSWSLPGINVPLAAEQIHVWRAYLDVPRATVARLRQTLSPEEKARADNYHFEIDRDRFVVARANLRNIISHYVAANAAEIRFKYSAHGKPSIAAPPKAAQLHFNLAHSSGLALYVVTLEREIGVDLEQIHPEFAVDEIAQRFFSANELAEVDSLVVGERSRAFFDCWTRKEALLKAKGTGLSDRLDEIDLTPFSDESAIILKADQDEDFCWFVRTIDVGSDFAAAVAVRGRNCNICYWQLEENLSGQGASSILGYGVS